MSQDQGFLGQLGIDDPTAEAVVEAKRAEAFRGRSQQFRALGQQGAQAVAGVGKAVGGLFSGDGRSFGGFKDNLKAGAAAEVDRQAAQVLGIRPEQLQARRAIQRELSKPEYADDGTFGRRKEMAQKMYELAKQYGDEQSMARALQAIDRLKIEETEFAKLQAETREAEWDSRLSTGFTPDGTPVTGELGYDEYGQAGLWTSEMGTMVHKPFGDGLTLIDPTKASAKMREPGWLAHQLKINNPGVITGLKQKASAAVQSLYKTDRVLTRLQELFKGGMVQDVMGRSGGFIQFVDNLARDTRGIINAFGGGKDAKAGTTESGETRSWNGVEGLRSIAGDSTHWLAQLITLPPGVEATSAAAQQHRAAVMEMAYMAARLAEPSNRGLSDNDIKNALTRIAGDTSNPQVMMRKFLEMQVDAHRELDSDLEFFYGTMGPDISDEDIATALLGKGYGAYSKRKQDMFDKFGVRVTPDGQVLFDEVIDVDVQPGGEVAVPTEAPSIEDEQSYQEWLDSFINEGETTE